MRVETIESDDNSFCSQQLIEEKIIEANGVVQVKHYEKIKFLSEHSNGKYYLIQDVNQKKKYRAKIIFKNQLKSKDKGRLLVEISNQKRIQHPNFVKLIKVFQNSHYVYLLTQLLPNGSVQQLLQRKKRLSQQQVSFYFKNLIDILIELKKQKIIHRDIKLQNLHLGDNMNLKLDDFGRSCNYQGYKRKSVLKLNHYSSPEIINQSGHGFQTDLWSVGVMIYRMLVGAQPFKDGNTFSISKIRNANVFFPENIPISLFWKDILKRIFVQNQSDRITINQLSELEIPNLPESIPLALLNVPNRLPCFNQRKNKQINSRFIDLHNVNFNSSILPDGTNNVKPKISNLKLVKSDLIKSIALELSMNTSKIYKKSTHSVVDDWIIMSDTIAYVIGSFVCVNFGDKSRIYNSHNTTYYQNPEGGSSTINQQIAVNNKQLHRKFRYHKSMMQSFETSQQQLDAGCPFFVEKVFVEDKYVLFCLSNNYYQLCFADEPKTCYLIISKGKVQYFIGGKQADHLGSKLGQVEKIMNSYKKVLKY